MRFDKIALITEARRSDAWRRRDWDDRGTLEVDDGALRFAGESTRVRVQPVTEVGLCSAPYPRRWLVTVGLVLVGLYVASVALGLGGLPATQREWLAALMLAGLFAVVAAIMVPVFLWFRPRMTSMVQVTGTDDEGQHVTINFAYAPAVGMPFGVWVRPELVLAIERAKST